MKRVSYLAFSCAAVFTMAGCGGGGSGGTISACTKVDFKGKYYCAIVSPYTGRTWLDRNLGADAVCSATDDVSCFGDYYQWGRLADGHEKVNSTKTFNLAEDINTTATPVEGFFIMNPSNLPYDWVNTANNVDNNGSLRTAQWSLTDGAVCPPGYRVPTAGEFKAELFSTENNISNSTDAFNSFLKLPSAGYRLFEDGTLDGSGTFGALWTTDAAADLSADVEFNSTAAGTNESVRALGQSLRCIKQ